MPSICQPQKLASWAGRHRWAAAWSATLLISGCAPLPTSPTADGVTASSAEMSTPAGAAPTAPTATSDGANARPSRWGWWRHDRQGAEAVAKVAPPPPKLSDKPEPEVQVAPDARNSDQKGVASWYGPGFHGRLTANGERFNSGAMTAAHRSFAFGTRVCVRSSVTGKTVVVRINDRGPFAKGRVIDLSQEAAERLGMMGLGVKPVELWALADDESSCPGTEDDDEVDRILENRVAGLNPEARRALEERRGGQGASAKLAAQKGSKKKK